MNQKFLTPGEIAKELLVSTKTVLRMIRAGELKAICMRAGKRDSGFRVYREAFELWQRQHEVKVRCRASRSPVLSVLPNRTESSAVQAGNIRDISQQSSSVEFK